MELESRVAIAGVLVVSLEPERHKKPYVLPHDRLSRYRQDKPKSDDQDE